MDEEESLHNWISKNLPVNPWRHHPKNELIVEGPIFRDEKQLLVKIKLLSLYILIYMQCELIRHANMKPVYALDPRTAWG